MQASRRGLDAYQSAYPRPCPRRERDRRRGSGEAIEARCAVSRESGSHMQRVPLKLFEPMLYTLDASALDSTAMCWGAFSGRLTTMEKSKRYHGDINTFMLVQDGRFRLPTPGRRSDGGTPLVLAITRNNARAVEWLIDNEAKLDRPAALLGPYGHGPGEWNGAIPTRAWMPLYWAIRHGNEHLVDLLLQRGSGLMLDGTTASSPTSVTALHIAAAYGHHSLVERLLEEPSIKVGAADSKGNTPLHYAAEGAAVDGVYGPQYPRTSSHVIAVLIQLGADANMSNDAGLSPIYLAVREQQCSARFERYRGPKKGSKGCTLFA
ncbi:ankyrin repeat-containing domain protein [Lasiosphaeria hispida]|uniref:Ankyrin repeat-containing domain protein n=1 Tax=Lasiosphaeria hispida TaxID=260671 RepID=A0AAJ0HWG0_9PEZI|nr:ankyrin repeat-containing domain protein [Lasiosphaeria hispida]